MAEVRVDNLCGLDIRDGHRHARWRLARACLEEPSFVCIVALYNVRVRTSPILKSILCVFSFQPSLDEHQRRKGE